MKKIDLLESMALWIGLEIVDIVDSKTLVFLSTLQRKQTFSFPDKHIYKYYLFKKRVDN